MVYSLWLELKVLTRRPSWWILVVASIGVSWFLGRGVPGISLASIGEWGRHMVATAHSLGFILAGILAVGSSAYESAHREILWSTPRAEMKSVPLQSLGIGFAALLAIICGTSIAFLIGRPWTTGFVPLGGRYAAVSLLKTLLTLSFSAAAMMMLHSCTRSRWAAIAIFLVTWVGFGSVVVPRATVVAALMMNSSVADPFAPFGLVPTAFFLILLVSLGGIFVLSGGTLLVRRRYPEWQGVKGKAPILLTLVGIALLVGGSYGSWSSMQHAIAPFSAQQLWKEEVSLDRPYVWDSEGSLLAFHGYYIAFHIPATASVPEWTAEMARDGRDLHRYEIEVLQVSSKEGVLIRRLSGDYYRVSLILIYPAGRGYPLELSGAVAHFRQTISPMIERARLWHINQGEWKIIVVPSGEGLSPLMEGVHPIPSGLLVSCMLVQGRLRDRALWGITWQLAEAAGLDDAGTTYLALSLMARMALEEASGAVAFYRNAVGTGLVQERWPGWPAYAGIRGDIDQVRQVLHHWQQGEELGHENYIRTLLEGRN